MKFAILLFNYFPHGGLQRGCLAIAHSLRDRGHAVSLFTGSWQGPRPDGIAVHILGRRGLTNHGRARAFARDALGTVGTGRFDAVVGFNRMPGLDIYNAGDSCFVAQAQERHMALYRLTPRYRHFAAFERAVFAPEATTEIILQVEAQKEVYQRHYGTPAERFHLVPPGISRDRRRPPNADSIRRTVRAELGLADEDRLLLMVGSSFKTKGHDRAIHALAALPPPVARRARLLAIGANSARPFDALARRLGVADRVQVLAARDDVTRFFLAADLLLHPSRAESAGSVILEAMISGLPVLCTGICGFAEHVRRAEAGQVLPEPFRQDRMNAAVLDMLTSPLAPVWAANGVAYGESTDLYSGREAAAATIERLAEKIRR